MARTKTPKGEICEWRQDGDGTWWSVCGVAYQFTTEHGPRDHGHVFCHKCGKILHEVALHSDQGVTKTPDIQGF